MVRLNDLIYNAVQRFKRNSIGSLQLYTLNGEKLPETIWVVHMLNPTSKKVAISEI